VVAGAPDLTLRPSDLSVSIGPVDITGCGALGSLVEDVTGVVRDVVNGFMGGYIANTIAEAASLTLACP